LEVKDVNKLSGRAAWVFGDNVDVDSIVGIENISTTDVAKLVADVMKAYDPDFKKKAKPGDFIVAGGNLGYGHPHPQPMIALRELGIDTIIAESFAFPFYRSELAKGMKLFECPDISKHVQRWDEIEVDVANNTLINKTQQKHLSLVPIPEIPMAVMEAGGLVKYLREIR